MHTRILLSTLLIFVYFIGATVYGDDHKSADQLTKNKTFTECAAVRMREVNLKHLESGDTSKFTTAIPEGWTVVSGSGGEGHPKLLLCR